MSFVIGNDDLVRFTLFQKLYLQDVINVFWYQFQGNTASDVASSDKIGEALYTSVVGLLRLRTSVKLTYVRGELTHIEAPDFNTATFPYAEEGLVLGECLPSFVSIGVQLRMTSRVVKTGYKRFAGVEETQTVDGELSPTPLALWQLIANGWVDGIQVTDDLGEPVGFLKPIVCKSDSFVGGVPTVFRPVTSAVVMRNLGSQNSRKIGYGS